MRNSLEVLQRLMSAAKGCAIGCVFLLSLVTQAQNADLSIRKIVEPPCLNFQDGNLVTLQIINIGGAKLDLPHNTRIQILEEVPGNSEINVITNDENWVIERSATQLTLERYGEGTIEAGSSLNISYRVKTDMPYTSRTQLNVNPAHLDQQTSNNLIAAFSIKAPLATPVVNDFFYCTNEEAVPFSGTATSGNSLLWYEEEGGVPSEVGFTPDTSEPGITTYYVSETNGECESELVPVQVYVLGQPTSGEISGTQEICRNTSPQEFSSLVSGSLPAPEMENELSYRWEVLAKDSDSWEAIAGATEETYKAGVIAEKTSFRRITIVEVGGIRCNSEPTDAVLITTKQCAVTINPMMPSRATTPQEL